MIFLFLFFFSHFLAAFIVYFNHRFILHGFLKKYSFFKQWAKLHALHHAFEKDPRYLFMPWYGSFVIALLYLYLIIIATPIGLGLLSFSVLYTYRHWSIHNTDFSSNFFWHHNYHHYGNAKKNFSGVYPFIDKIFGTYEEVKLSHQKVKR